MNHNKKRQKINPFLIASIALCLLFLFVLISKLNFVYRQVESVLADRKSPSANQKSFNMEDLKLLKEK